MKPHILLLCLLILAAPALGFGLSPASTSATTPQAETFELRVLNQQDIDATLTVRVEDDYGIVTLPESHVQLQQGVSEVRMPFTLYTPQDLLPGTYTAAIVVEQQPPQGTTETVAATHGVRHRITISVPQEGTFLDASIVASAGATGAPQTVGVRARNVGTLDIPDAHVMIRVRGPAGDVLHEHTSEQQLIVSGEQHRFDTQWTPPSSGEYVVEATVRYADQTQELSSDVSIGTLSLTLGELSTGPYQYGEVLRLDLPIHSEWNRHLRNVYATIRVEYNGEEVDSFTTPRTTALPQDTTTLQGFWNTQGAAMGTHTIIATAHYGAQRTTRSYTLTLGADGLSVPRDVPGLSWQLSLSLLIAAITLAFIIFRRLARKQ